MLATVFLIAIAMTFCNKENMNVNEVLIKQQDTIDNSFKIFNFVGFDIDSCAECEDIKIVRPEEERFLKGGTNLESLIHFIPLMTKDYGSGIVLAVRDDRDGYVLFTRVGANIIHPAWYDRLHGYIMDHYSDSSFATTIDTIDTDNPFVNCICTFDINIAYSFIISSF